MHGYQPKIGAVAPHVTPCGGSAEQKPEQEAIRFIGDMQRIQMQPGDMLVLQVDRVLSDEMFNRLTQRMTEIFGKGKVVILDHNMKLGVIGAVEA